MSCSTKNALALNQLQHVEILTSYKRSEDGVTMYVLDVSLNPYQTGIPNVCMSAEFIDGRFQNRDTTASIISSTSPRSIVPQPPPTAQFSQSDASNATERNNKIKSKHASAHANKSQPHYQLEYRFSAFRELRTRLRDAVEESDRHHLKWCWYCSKIQWVATFGGFPSRHPLLKFLTKHSRCGESLERVLLDKVICRRQRLALFVNEVVASAKNASYRYQSAQCGCYAKVAVIVTDFLAEPHMRACIGDSNGGTAW